MNTEITELEHNKINKYLGITEANWINHTVLPGYKRDFLESQIRDCVNVYKIDQIRI